MLALTAALASTLVPAAPAPATGTSLGTCTWLVRNDPALVNAVYPDAGAGYYITALPAAPPGTRYRIRGEFPHARYISFAAYNGLPIDAVADVDIVPDAGSSNPFRPGADRDVAHRGYTVELIAEPPPAPGRHRVPGALYVGRGQQGTPAPAFYLMYRLYVPDEGTGVRGGVGLPALELVSEHGAVLDPAVTGACEQSRDALPTGELTFVQDAYASAAPPAAPVAPPGDTDPPTWSVESGAAALVAGWVGQGGLVSGGPANNPHNLYVLTTISRAHGPVVAIRARAPVTPRTRDGNTTMQEGDLRYFSFCQNSRITRYVACLDDEDVVVDEDGTFTIAISAPADRPASAENWIPFGPDPDAQLMYRHMLPSERFYPHSAQYVRATGAPIEAAMGAYYPRATYCTAAEFDERGCGL